MAELKLKQDPFAAEQLKETSPSSSRGTSIDVWRTELDDYYGEMQGFGNMDPVEVFLRLSAYSARASEIRSQIVRSENRRHLSFRTQEIDPFIDECDRQFKLHSRIQATREMEFKMSGGAV